MSELSDVAVDQPPHSAPGASPNERPVRTAKDFIERLADLGLAKVAYRIELTLLAHDSFELLLDAEHTIRTAWPIELASVPLCEVIWTGETDNVGEARLRICAFDRVGRPLLRADQILDGRGSLGGAVGEDVDLASATCDARGDADDASSRADCSAVGGENGIVFLIEATPGADALIRALSLFAVMGADIAKVESGRSPYSDPGCATIRIEVARLEMARVQFMARKLEILACVRSVATILRPRP